MLKLSTQQQADFSRRCYPAVDGLWFVKLEEKLGFKKTLAVDRKVWQVLPNIQARALKALGKKGAGLEALADCFAAKLRMEGFTFKIKQKKNSAVISITRCPWHDIAGQSRTRAPQPGHQPGRLQNRIYRLGAGIRAGHHLCPRPAVVLRRAGLQT
jgi:hypothetical protein